MNEDLVNQLLQKFYGIKQAYSSCVLLHLGKLQVQYAHLNQWNVGIGWITSSVVNYLLQSISIGLLKLNELMEKLTHKIPIGSMGLL